MHSNQAARTAGGTMEGMDFERVHQEYRERVRAYAGKLLGPGEAEDVTQEVFLKVSRSLETLSDPARLTSWIYAITLNAARDAVRRKASRPRIQDEATRGDESKDRLYQIEDPRSRTPEETAIRAEMVECYLDYVRRLRPIYYEVYALSEFERLSNEEIARRLSLPVGTVKMRLHRARTRVNEDLRSNCRCYTNERGELMGEPKRPF